MTSEELFKAYKESDGACVIAIGGLTINGRIEHIDTKLDREEELKEWLGDGVPPHLQHIFTISSIDNEYYKNLFGLPKDTYER